MHPSRPRPSWLRVWTLAARPHTLPLSASPILAGIVLAWAETGQTALGVSVAALLTAVAIQIATNLHNDAADSLDGTDQPDRKGPLRVVQAGWVSAQTVQRAAHLVFGFAFLCGLVLVVKGGWPILLAGLASLLAGYAYSAGPWPIARGPFGEVFVTLFFGLVAVAGMTFLITGTVTLAALLLGLGVGLTAAAVLLVNNTRDREGDTRAGRRTLAIRLERPGINRLYAWFMGGAVASVGLMALSTPVLWGGLAVLACVPLARKAIRAFWQAEDPCVFNLCLKRTAGFQVVLCGCLCVGLIVTRVVF
ncbi:1,4-dihydroxy-2-naphthoate octaprenyltransferase [Pararhodospirillum photometricum]|uniref:1,4-dihydroxy-2-naphthoate octaprenyltransferase n=1 Tax=Pararhodospirillum photometricum DSM 122 TaxID=1150469 RepID=H6SP86_PARPM|nr:1,4-dihydroxy-2-naphthoate octaprenyltransferase [Pararhodospirillum photometricum]CCG09411.1 1,4-Dihydroxy-2-naphtoate prenyltransferase [Pararhodospirillum photometricum DSM 122]